MKPEVVQAVLDAYKKQVQTDAAAEEINRQEGEGLTFFAGLKYEPGSGVMDADDKCVIPDQKFLPGDGDAAKEGAQIEKLAEKLIFHLNNHYLAQLYTKKMEGGKCIYDATFEEFKIPAPSTDTTTDTILEKEKMLYPVTVASNKDARYPTIDFVALQKTIEASKKEGLDLDEVIEQHLDEVIEQQEGTDLDDSSLTVLDLDDPTLTKQDGTDLDEFIEQKEGMDLDDSSLTGLDLDDPTLTKQDGMDHADIAAGTAHVIYQKNPKDAPQRFIDLDDPEPFLDI